MTSYDYIILEEDSGVAILTLNNPESRNPLTDDEIEQKFDALAERFISSNVRARLKRTVWNLEKLGAVTELMALCRADI